MYFSEVVSFARDGPDILYFLIILSRCGCQCQRFSMKNITKGVEVLFIKGLLKHSSHDSLNSLL